MISVGKLVYFVFIDFTFSHVVPTFRVFFSSQGFEHGVQVQGGLHGVGMEQAVLK